MCLNFDRFLPVLSLGHIENIGGISMTLYALCGRIFWGPNARPVLSARAFCDPSRHLSAINLYAMASRFRVEIIIFCARAVPDITAI